MLLRSIQAENLLSFEELNLSLTPGLTVIVGPNDSGKSNLVRILRLVRTAATVPLSGGPAFEPGIENRFVRNGSPEGIVRIGIALSEDRERRLMLTYVRAIAACAIESTWTGQSRTPDESAMLQARLTKLVEESIDEAQIEPLMRGSLVLALDRRQPAHWGLVYEFRSNDETFHIGVVGSGIARAAVSKGAFVLDRLPQPMINPRIAVDAASPEWLPLGLGNLLPVDEPAVSWNLAASPSSTRTPWLAALSRELGLAADQSRLPDLWWVLREALGRGIVVTENLRRPPRELYSLDEARGDAASVEDAGDLPLELFHWKTGSPVQRQRWAGLQRRFLDLTGHVLDLQTYFPRTKDVEALRIELQVSIPSGWIPITNAGAGLWEAVVALSATLQESGQVVLLDEPATNLDSNWQARLLALVGSQHQTILITHSAFLLPTGSADDLLRVTRLDSTDGATSTHSLDPRSVPDGWLSRWRQLLAGSADARTMLFARGVLLVEGETELGALRLWFNDARVTGTAAPGLDGRNLVLISVDGDNNFGPYVSYLGAMGIPWAVLADGPALSPVHNHSLIKQLSARDSSRWPEVMTGGQPTDSDDFASWRTYWESNGVFTAAVSFGLSPDGAVIGGDGDDSGEIEGFLRSLDPALWDRHKTEGVSKVRRGHAFASELDLAAGSVSVGRLSELWTKLQNRLDPDS